MKMPYEDVVDDFTDDEGLDRSKLYLHSGTSRIYRFNPDTKRWLIKAGHHDGIQMDLTKPKAPVYSIRMTVDGDDTSFARAAPGTAITMFGRYETIGKIAPIDGENIPVLPGLRGQGSMQCPMFDLEWVAKKTGYPCKATEMPETIVHCDAYLPKDMFVNTLIDLYFEWMDDGVDMNTHISPNKSRYLNLQIQCDRGREINPLAHAGGMSGGEFILRVKIGNQTWDIAYKHEQANGNSFPFLSFSPINDDGSTGRVGSVEISEIKNWLFANWSMIESSCEENGCDLFGVTLERLKESFIDSPHIFNEVLGYAVGTIRYKRLEILVDGFDYAKEGDAPKDYVDTPVEKKPNALARFLQALKKLFRLGK